MYQQTVILDMGGRDDPLSEELLKTVDIISPNETELKRVMASAGFDDEMEILSDEN